MKTAVLITSVLLYYVLLLAVGMVTFLLRKLRRG
jgi:hypothetical protein